MFNKEFFDKVLQVTCTLDELKNINAYIRKEEFDLDNPFEKYYNLDILLLAIDKYRRGIIDKKYLTRWAIAYDRLISREGRAVSNSKSPLVRFVCYEITEWLDSLSFLNYSDGDDELELKLYAQTFKTLDKVYHDAANCKAVYTLFDEDEDDDIAILSGVVLVINDTEKYFSKLYADLTTDEEFVRITVEELDNKVKQLKKEGYAELKCGLQDCFD